MGRLYEEHEAACPGRIVPPYFDELTGTFPAIRAGELHCQRVGVSYLNLMGQAPVPPFRQSGAHRSHERFATHSPSLHLTRFCTWMDDCHALD